MTELSNYDLNELFKPGLQVIACNDIFKFGANMVHSSQEVIICFKPCAQGEEKSQDLSLIPQSTVCGEFDLWYLNVAFGPDPDCFAVMFLVPVSALASHLQPAKEV